MSHGLDAPDPVLDPTRLQVVVPEPFEDFFRREQRGLAALAYALTGNRAAAEDIAQDALVAANRRWDVIGRYDSPLAWCRRVVANRSTSMVRRRVSERRVVARLAGRLTDDVDEPMPSDSEHLWELIRALPRRQRQVVTLSALHRLSLREIGEVLGLSKESVQTHLARARRSLIHQLDGGSP